MKPHPFFKNKPIFLALLLLTPLSALADGHGMDGLILVFFLITALLFLPLVVLTIIAGVYSARPKERTLFFYKTFLGCVTLLYVVLAFLYHDLIEDLLPYTYLALLIVLFIGLINVWLIRSGNSSLKEMDGILVQPEENSVQQEKTDKRVFAYILVSFLLQFISVSINHAFPDWLNSDLKYLVFGFYFLNTLCFLLLLSLIQKPAYKIVAFVLVSVYLIVQAWDYVKLLRLGE
jgi:hypothetical protein